MKWRRLPSLPSVVSAWGSVGAATDGMNASRWDHCPPERTPSTEPKSCSGKRAGDPAGNREGGRPLASRLSVKQEAAASSESERVEAPVWR